MTARLNNHLGTVGYVVWWRNCRDDSFSCTEWSMSHDIRGNYTEILWSWCCFSFGYGIPRIQVFCLEVISAMVMIHTLIVYVDENQGRHNFLVSLCWLQIYLFKTGRMVEGVWRVFQALCILSRTSFQEMFFGEEC